MEDTGSRRRRRRRKQWREKVPAAAAESSPRKSKEKEVGECQGKGQGKGSTLDSSPDPDWLEVKSLIDSRIDSLFPDSVTFRPKDRYTDLDVMAIFQRVIEWEEHGNDVPSAVLRMRAIVKTHRWSGFVHAD